MTDGSVSSILIKLGSVEVVAELNDSETARSIWEALPITARGSTWGEEIYFSIPVQAELEDGREVVDLGDLAPLRQVPSGTDVTVSRAG